MTQQIKIAEYLNYLHTCKRISSANIIAFLVDMFHKAKYGEFLFSDVHYNVTEIKAFWLYTEEQLSDLIVSSKKAEEVYKIVMHHCISKDSMWQIETILVEKFDEIKNQDDAYRIFNQYIKDYILFRTVPVFSKPL